MTWDCFTEVVD